MPESSPETVIKRETLSETTQSIGLATAATAAADATTAGEAVAALAAATAALAARTAAATAATPLARKITLGNHGAPTLVLYALCGSTSCSSDSEM